MTQKYPYHARIARTFSKKLTIYLTIYTVLIVALVLYIAKLIFVS
jgi:hypothetical protein